MKTKRVISLLAAVMACLIVLSTCGMALAAEDDIVITSTEKVTLQLTTSLASTHNLVKVMTQEFAENVNKFTNGNVTVNIASDGQLMGNDGAADAISSGGVDLHVGAIAWLMGYDPILKGSAFAFGATSIDTWLESLDVVMPIFEAALEPYDIMNISTYPYSATVWGSNVPILLPEDIKGLNMRSAGPVWASVYGDLGATATALASADTYDAMDKGTIDGYFTGFNSIIARGLDAVTKYVVGIVEIPYYGIQINRTVFESLPEDYQAAILKAADIASETGLALYYEDANDEQTLLDEGIEVHFWTDEEADAWKQSIRPTLESWLEECTAAGKEAECRAILEVNFNWAE